MFPKVKTIQMLCLALAVLYAHVGIFALFNHSFKSEVRSQIALANELSQKTNSVQLRKTPDAYNIFERQKPNIVIERPPKERDA